MGGSFSAFNKFGLPGITSATTKQVYDNHFKNKDTATFEDFHIAYVEFCKYFNTVMPGQDFDTPSRDKIKDFYEKVWSKQDDEGKKSEFFKFMETEVHEDPRDDKLFITAGLAAPAAAVVGKRASQHIPYVKNVRLDLVPNVVFVPFVTLGAIMVATAVQIGSKSETKKDSDEDKKDSDEDKKGSGEAKKGSK